MHKVPDIWYKRINIILGVSALLVIIVFLLHELTSLLEFADILSLSLVGVVGYVLVLAQAFLFYLEKDKTTLQKASLLTTVATGVASLLLVHTSGGILSPWLYTWSLLLLAAGAYGFRILLIFIGVQLLYTVISPTGLLFNPASIAATSIYTTANLLMAMVSYYAWEHISEKTMELKSSQLQAEQLKSEIVINSIADGVMAVDNSGKIILYNPAAQNITGWKVEDALGLDCASVLKVITHGEENEITELPKNDHPIIKALNSAKKTKDESLQVLTASKKTIELSLNASPIVVKGVKQGVVAVFRDVSEERRAERQRADFISTASHEMRTPVAAIEGYLALALNEKVTKIDSKARNYLQKAHESTEHLGQLFKDLLTATKSEDGRLANHPIAVDINELLTQVIDDARFTVEKKGLKLNYAVAGDTGGNHGEKAITPLMYVHVDPERIREVIGNLINNAIKFTEEGGITVGLRAMPEYVQISVRDTGFGIPQEDIHHLFQKFYRVDSSSTRAIGGTGLGLFICKNIVEMYNGRIWVESKYGEGSTFYINLPRISAEKAAELKQQEEAQIKPLELESNL